MPVLRTALGLLALACTACAAHRGAESEIPAGAAALYVYVDALPAEAERLRIELSGVRVVREDGTASPLELALPRLEGLPPRRQRLLAFGFVPAGTYRGLAVDVASATLRGERGPGALRVPEAAETLAYPMVLGREDAALVVLRLQWGEALREGMELVPAFTAARPGLLAPGLTALILGEEAPTLTVVHKLTGEVFALRRTGRAPSAAVLDPGAERAYVVSAGDDVLEPHDLTRGVREPAFPLLSGDAPAALAISRDGRTLVSVNAGSGTVTILDAPVVAQRFRVPVGIEPRGIVLSPDDRRAFVLNTGSDSISVVDLTAGALLATIAVDASPRFAALDPSGRRLYVGHRDSPYIVVVRLADLSVERRAYVGPGLVALAVDPRTNRLFLARRGTGSIEVFDPQSLLPVDSIRSGGDASFLTIDLEGERLWAAMTRGRVVRTFRLVGGEPLSATDLGTNPAWIVVAGGR